MKPTVLGKKGQSEELGKEGRINFKIPCAVHTVHWTLSSMRSALDLRSMRTARSALDSA